MGLTKSPGFYLKALGASVGLSLLFLVVYGSCNWIAAQRHDVGTLYFEWERAIPFVPVMIIPYLSIDLFFVVAPFLCRDELDLAVFSKRIVAAIVVSGICFLLFPIRFAFERPVVSGWVGGLFNWFQGLDQPFNLVPSLHIVLQVILAEHYWKHTRGFWLVILNFWFVLIGISTLVTYQHHLMDVIAGLAVGSSCIFFIREPSPKSRTSVNRRVASYYAAATAAVICLVVCFWPGGALLLWPALALGVTSAAYFGFGAPVFWKANGKLHWSAGLVLAPCLLGQQLSLRYYRRGCQPWNKVTSTVWIGRVLGQEEAAAITSQGVTAVLDLTAEFSAPAVFRSLVYRSIPVLDLTAPTLEQLHEMASFIEDESSRGIVYVHCKIGYSRTAAAVAAYLLRAGRAQSVPDAIELIRQARPSIVIRPEIVPALLRFENATMLA